MDIGSAGIAGRLIQTNLGPINPQTSPHQAKVQLLNLFPLRHRQACEARGVSTAILLEDRR